MGLVEWLQFIVIILGCGAFVVVCGLVIFKARSKKEAEMRKYLVLLLLIVLGVAVVGFGPDALHWFGWDFLHKGGKGPEAMQKAIDFVEDMPSPGVQVTPTPVVQIDTTK